MTRKQFLIGLISGVLAWVVTRPLEARRDERDEDRGKSRRDERREHRPSGRSERESESRQEQLSLDEAVTRVRRETGGRVLSAEPRGKSTYRIKVLLPNGAVRVYHVDAHSGRTD